MCVFDTVEPEILPSLPRTCSHGQNFYPVIFLSHVKHYMEPMVIFTTWAKTYFSTEYFSNAKVAGLGIFFPVKTFSYMLYHKLWWCCPFFSGSCAAAGYTDCCAGGYCAGFPPNCFCEPNCINFQDCCNDFNSTCCKCTIWCIAN